MSTLVKTATRRVKHQEQTDAVAKAGAAGSALRATVVGGATVGLKATGFGLRCIGAFIGGICKGGK